MTFGIDISTYQNGLDLSNLKEKGIDFVIIRGGFTGSNKTHAIDDRFIQFYNSAKKAKLNVGVYYFSRATSYQEGVEEAKFLYNNCLKNRTFEYPIFIDVEDPIYQEKASKEDVSSAIRGFCDFIESKNGYAGVYCNLNWANNHMYYNELSKDFDFWLAYWGKEMPNRKVYGNYGMWQFGGSENLIRSNKINNKVCDQDYAYKDYPNIMLSKKLNNFNETPNEVNKTNNNKDSNNDFKDDIKNIVEKDIEEEIEDELKENKTKIFTFLWKLFKKLIGYILLLFKK